MNTNFDFSGKTAVIIGGAGSIGSEISKAFKSAGAKVAVADLSSDLYSVDVTDEESIKGLVKKTMADFKKIDILVMVQGVQIRKPFSEFTLEEWNKIIKVNLTGTFLALKHFSEPMKKAKYGKVVAITSLTTEFGIKNISAYAASKGGMSQFLKTAALELADYKINVNMVAPGRIATKMTKDIIKDKDLKESSLRCIPMGRFGEPEDLTGAVLFLASDFSSYMTGQTIFVDGGWLAGCGNPKD